ncbi:response regulator transcription factor [Paenibacillus macerans]|uniref:response regulator transcription factor n=1 Tax=Paenibacillus macerans TaxID=44252 RepID=UPI002041D3BA|nr:response regulator transcription factor [Paenibacillus macerans]MCM3702298.1 response regulator transcription factor [Paenibacillus macerans]
MVTILIVEDDQMVRLLTKAKLSPLYKIKEAANGQEALEVLDREHIDLLVVDIQMPNMNGYELVRTLRDADDMTPVIMLTAMNSFSHKKEGFASGVDDYMTKPIDYEELIWRIEALLRRAQIANEKRIVIGDFSMEQNTFSAQYNEETIPLTNKEFDLLYKFLSYPNVVFTKQQLMDEIWGYDSETEYDTIKTYISRLRNKFSMCKEFELISIRGLGYKAVIHKMGGGHETV